MTRDVNDHSTYTFDTKIYLPDTARVERNARPSIASPRFKFMLRKLFVELLDYENKHGTFIQFRVLSTLLGKDYVSKFVARKIQRNGMYR